MQPDGEHACNIGFYRHWAADNGCFAAGDSFDLYRWLRWLDGLTRVGCLFAAAPDVVGDAGATIERSMPVLEQVRGLGFPAAFVAQNGIERMDVPWDAFDVLFVGGAPECVPCRWVKPIADRRDDCPTCRRPLSEWKLGEGAHAVTAAAKERGKWAHLGRVNSLRRLRAAATSQYDSADGTYLRFGPDVNLPKLERMLDSLHQAPQMLLPGRIVG